MENSCGVVHVDVIYECLPGSVYIRAREKEKGLKLDPTVTCPRTAEGNGWAESECVVCC